MKRSRSCLLVSVTCLVICFSLVGMARSEEAAQVTVKEAAICLDVVDHVCVDPNDVFPSDMGKLYCFSRIQGAQEDIEITHVWYFGEIERARVKLAVRSVNFRTFSSKIIRPHEIGAWHVNILDPDDKLLKTVQFEIVQ